MRGYCGLDHGSLHANGRAVPIRDKPFDRERSYSHTGFVSNTHAGFALVQPRAFQRDLRNSGEDRRW